ncbi:MAG: carboxymuconolactone decarboxylase family protein [Candidatus Dormibacteria bacterium]
MNASRLWVYQPATVTGLFDLMRAATSANRLTLRQRGILVAACAATFGDSYCSLAWGTKVAASSDPQIASAVIRGDDSLLSEEERAMATWAHKVAGDPSATTTHDIEALRDAGFSDHQIFAMTAYLALRIAFSTVNDALGARPDAAYRTDAPEAVLEAVTFGRPIEGEPAATEHATSSASP